MNDHSILIVEDDMGLATVLTRIIKKVHPEATLTWATDMAEALGKIQKQKLDNAKPFDLILSDLLLPNAELGTSLWSFCRVHQPQTPFAVMSSVEPSTYFRMFAGKDEPPPFLPKPFRVEDCQELLSFMLLGHGSDNFGG
jgi:CheY-like chemotaxis protein